MAVDPVARVIARRPWLLAVLAMLALPFRVPIQSGGLTSNLLVPLYLVVAAGSLVFRPALAADPVFPPGMRVGLTPLVGLVPAKSFVGFETEDHGVKVLVTELPAQAYGEVANAFKANPDGAGGVKPESIETPAGLAYYTT